MQQLKLPLQLCLTTCIILQLLTCSNSNPTPSPWPLQFHAFLFMNLTTTHLQLSDLWYDWPRGRNVNIFQKQLGEVLYDMEWNNGTSFYYSVSDNGSCEVMGLWGLKSAFRGPIFLTEQSILGWKSQMGFFAMCGRRWILFGTMRMFTLRPVRWDFYDGISSQVMTFEVGAVLPDTVTQAPAYCFNQDKDAYRP